jgi:hypothetical protein
MLSDFPEAAVCPSHHRRPHLLGMRLHHHPQRKLLQVRELREDQRVQLGGGGLQAPQQPGLISENAVRGVWLRPGGSPTSPDGLPKTRYVPTLRAAFHCGPG